MATPSTVPFLDDHPARFIVCMRNPNTGYVDVQEAYTLQQEALAYADFRDLKRAIARGILYPTPGLQALIYELADA